MNADRPITNADIIQSLIQSNNRAQQTTCINYFNTDNEVIMAKETNDFTQTHKIPSSFYSDICQQTANYVVGKKVTICGLKDDSGLDPNVFLTRLCTDAAKLGVGWVYLYIEDGKLIPKIIDGYEVLPIWDTNFQDTLVQLIRYYKVEVITDAGATIRTRVECWDREKVVYYIEDEKGILGLDFIFAQQAIQYHITTSSYVLDSIVAKEERGWGMVPFIPLKFNKELKPELSTAMKSLIDAYDGNVSEFQDNLSAVDDAVLLLKDRTAENYEDLMTKIKKYHCLKVDDTGDAKYLVIDYPFQARKTSKDDLKEAIYDCARAVDVSKLTRGGGQITTAFIESLFFKLDQKGDEFIKQINDFLKLFYGFMNIYRGIVGGAIEDVDSLEFHYDKSRPDNLAEKVATANSCKGIISLRTMLANHPFVTNVDEEIALIEADDMQYLDMTGGGVGGNPNNTGIQQSTGGLNQNSDTQKSNDPNGQGNNPNQ
jgi:SPP1 family phage portal protein